MNTETETFYDANTPAEVKAKLDYAWRFNRRVRIWMGDIETGEAWADEYGVIGRVGRSMGVNRVFLLMNNSRSRGGGAILTARVVAIMDVKSRRFTYKHEKFTTGVWSIKSAVGGTCRVYRNNVERASFADHWKASNYVAFMKGERFKK